MTKKKEPVGKNITIIGKDSIQTLINLVFLTY